MSTERRKINSINLSYKLQGINHKTDFGVENSTGAILQTTDGHEYKRCAIAWGRNSYIIFNSFLPAKSKLFYKNSKSPTLYSDKQQFIHDHANKKTCFCVLSKCISNDINSLFVIEYYFAPIQGEPIKTLALTECWLDVDNVSLKYADGGEVNKPVENNMLSGNNNPDGLATGLFFDNENFDSVTEILSNYYEYRFINGNPVTILNKDALKKWKGHIGSEGIINSKALLSFWKGTKSEQNSNYLISSMLKHDRSSTYGFAKKYIGLLPI